MKKKVGAKSAKPVATETKKIKKEIVRPPKQRVLVFSSRGVTHRSRHLQNDIRALLPHSKTDAKLDSKDQLNVVNEVCELKNCNNCVFLESRKRKDLYLWMAKAPEGPSVKFLVQNIHTMDELKMTGNCLKGSRPLLIFDKTFDAEPHLQLIKESLNQIFCTPHRHPRSKPFVDHALAFYYLDGRIWFRHYQIRQPDSGVAHKSKAEHAEELVEIGPRFVLQPIRVFEGSFGGPTLYENPEYVSPNQLRSELRRSKANKYVDRKVMKKRRDNFIKENALPVNPLDSVFE
eukprot:GCRY01001175.1.p1 GENE.GCRY01001175.1~~GCRY01001175.1.p1  ORF type:complete len:315 (+),score=22.36 GCRY01001175.1:79-945(+)